MKEERDRLSKRDVRERSKLVIDNLYLLPDFFRADVVHTYVSSKNNEVDTHELIRLLLKQRKRVVAPIADKATKQMRHSELFSLSELGTASYGILEPRIYRPVPVADLNVVVVPALAVDRKGNRLGFGAGFYDRFLHDVKLPTVALAYDFQVLNDVPKEQTDIAVSFIVTESEIIKCSTSRPTIP
ncbi:MAG: 5-formyltetrahydrofolate cyclo-ligase [Ignavibacteriales bacterium]|nr:5-formyltetrahydrofolate cyclo-ligase [Ignavibacteriales bacterium]